MQNDKPQHIVKGIELASKLKPSEVYKKLLNYYRPYVERGDEYEHMLKTQYGGTFGDFEGSFTTGGYLNGEKLKRGLVGVELSDGRVFTYKLAEIYKDILTPQTSLF